MESKPLQDETYLRDLKAVLERLSGQIQISALQSSSRKREDSSKDCALDELNRHDIRDIADEVRKGFFRKEDKTPALISSAMGVIALIAAMTAILQPMNNQSLSLKEELKQFKQEVVVTLKDHTATQDRDMQRTEERIKEAVRDLNLKIEALQKADTIDKTVNERVSIMYDQLQKRDNDDSR